MSKISKKSSRRKKQRKGERRRWRMSGTAVFIGPHGLGPHLSRLFEFPNVYKIRKIKHPQYRQKFFKVQSHKKQWYDLSIELFSFNFKIIKLTHELK